MKNVVTHLTLTCINYQGEKMKKDKNKGTSGQFVHLTQIFVGIKP